LDILRGWQDAPAVVLSCPGPMRRHEASLLPMSRTVLPQVFLGGESQLLAFAAAVPGLAPKLFFAPLPEIFAGQESLQQARRALGTKEANMREMVHLRFGSVRDARVLKGARNAAVVAEFASAPMLTASHHPFAHGHVVPAAIGRLYIYGPKMVRPQAMGGVALPATRLPQAFVAADLAASRPALVGKRGAGAPAGLDLVRLADFNSAEWAAGAVWPAQAGIPPWAGKPAVLLPWNMAHFGSIVPRLLGQLTSLRRPGTPMPLVVILPFNYLGQTGIIRALIADLRAAAADPETVLNEMILARVSHLRGLAPLKAISRVAWVDGNDPEYWWSLSRLSASGFDPILIDPSSAGNRFSTRLAADEDIRVEVDTRFGALSFDARLPSLRALPRLLAMTGERMARPRPARRAARP